MELKIKWLYEHISVLVFFKEYFCFSLSSTPHHSSTLAYPSSTYDNILPSLLAPLNKEYFEETDRGLL